MKASVERVKDTDELMAMRPMDRQRYVRNLLLDVLETEKDYTISELVAKTNLNRNTITKHLNDLVSRLQVIRTTRGMGQIKLSFYKKVKLEHKQTKPKKRAESGNTFYVFFLLENSEDRSICIQQKEYDEYGVENVVASITIKDSMMKKFIKELHGYAAEVLQT